MSKRILPTYRFSILSSAYTDALSARAFRALLIKNGKIVLALAMILGEGIVG
jgi:hypothetical protein